MAKTKSTKSIAAAKPAASKIDRVRTLLRREGGAALTEITDATGWLPHSARAVLTGFRKKGFALDKSKVEGVTRYKIAAEPTA